MKFLIAAIIATMFVGVADARDYYHAKWFDYPEIGTPPRISNAGCGKKACTKVPHVSHWHVSMRMACTCVNPLVKTELLRRDVIVVVSGPDTINKAAVNALEGYAAGCVAAAIAASTAGPQVVASPAGFYASFKACLLGVSAEGVAGGIIKQFDIHLSGGTHWSPV